MEQYDVSSWRREEFMDVGVVGWEVWIWGVVVGGVEDTCDYSLDACAKLVSQSSLLLLMTVLYDKILCADGFAG